LGFDWWAVCLTKAEWAAWVQAIGTLATLAVAALVVRYEIKQRRLDSSEANATGLTARLHLVVLMTAQLENFIEKADPGQILATTAYKYHFNSLKSACERVRAIDLIELPTRQSMFYLGAIHQDVATIELTLSMVENIRPSRNEHDVFQRLLGRIEVNVEALAKEADRLRRGLRE